MRTRVAGVRTSRGTVDLGVSTITDALRLNYWLFAETLVAMGIALILGARRAFRVFTEVAEIGTGCFLCLR